MGLKNAENVYVKPPLFVVSDPYVDAITLQL